ncbi:helix-turn-helix domain-containing protein [Leptospira broomii]|uniref:helix-turn-helix domain-containing protein n=1 Tax=Leptospira broomii TaxID=301541 RepID=UPI000288CBAA|nr:MerR family transcriptional regulator [Leptospira broomii]TGM09674.1 MerR family transcriptional regulator [Leptospira yasudae]
MLIGDLVRKTGISRDTIRYYEKEGLFKNCLILRRDNNYKEYSTDVLEQLDLIHTLRNLNFPISDIAELIRSRQFNLVECENLSDTLDKNIKKIDLQIISLLDLKNKLNKIKNDCSPNCTYTNKMPSCISC